MKWIPLIDCRNRKLYRINSRNLSLGVFNEKTKGFIGLRYKFGDTFAFTEYHWDVGEPFGTVQPQEELPEELPEDILLNESGPTICINCRVEVEFLYDKENVRESHWIHLAPTECKKVCSVGTSNEALEKWLHNMKCRYR